MNEHSNILSLSLSLSHIRVIPDHFTHSDYFFPLPHSPSINFRIL